MTFESIGEKGDIFSAGVVALGILNEERILPLVFHHEDVRMHIREIVNLLESDSQDRVLYLEDLKSMRESTRIAPLSQTIFKLAASCLEINPSKRPSAKELYEKFISEVR
ncbi:MAG: hypothetical protein ACI9S8_001760 [Chlamydiales bacterium]|jgi:serine/threonine protein kinase